MLSSNQKADAVISQLVITFGSVVHDVALFFWFVAVCGSVCAPVVGCVILLVEVVVQSRFGSLTEICGVITTGKKTNKSKAGVWVGAGIIMTSIFKKKKKK